MDPSLPAVVLITLATATAAFAFLLFKFSLALQESLKEAVLAGALAVLFLTACFLAGFSLRATGQADKITLGHALTDFSFLAAYLLIGFSGLLGQARYWFFGR
jgi:hypothetical protein